MTIIPSLLALAAPVAAAIYFIGPRVALGFVKHIPWQAKVGAAGLVLGFVLFQLHSHQIKKLEQASYQHGVDDTVKMFKAAQDAADAKAHVEVKHTVTAQAAISKGASNALSHDLDSIDARAAAIRVRHDAQASRGRSLGAVDPSAPRTAASGPCEAPAGDGLAWSVAYPLMVQAAKNEAQLNAILDWEEKQQALDASAPSEVAPQ